MLEQSVYSLDLVPCDFFFLFPKLKGNIKNTHFPDVEALKGTMTKERQRIPGESFQGCMEEWCRRMGKCAGLERDYLKVLVTVDHSRTYS